MRSVLERLTRLEEQNQALTQEVQTLRDQLTRAGLAPTSPAVAPPAPVAAPEETAPGTGIQAAAAPSNQERISVAEARIEEQAQSKVEASQRLPVKLTGMVLFNLFANTGPAWPWASPAYTAVLTGPNTAGATVRQSSVGFDFQGPSLPGDGRVSGSLQLYLSSGGGDSYASALRLRRGIVSFDWKDRSFFVGQDKLLVSARQPTSLAEVTMPALSASGNLWPWQPQVRYEERHHFTDNTGYQAQIAVLETAETNAQIPSSITNPSLEESRPGLEGRFQIWHDWGKGRRLEFAPSVHTSTTHVYGAGVPSRLYAMDWMVKPASWMEITGTWFTGKNLAPIGGLVQGYKLIEPGNVRAIRGTGGWHQVSFPVTPRLTFNAFGGWQNANRGDLRRGDIDTSFSFAANVIYRLGSNVLVSAEALQNRLGYVPYAPAVRNHYDIAIGYLF